MHKRHYAQRQHIIHSLDTLLYQLHTLSFFLSPSIWSFVFRLVCQFHCSMPREFDSTRSLRFFFSVVVFLNITSIWNHATQGAAEGRAIVLDFVGLAYVPSKLQLLALDFLIVFLQMVLTTIAYETSLAHNAESNIDTLLPIPPPETPSPAPTPSSSSPPSTPPMSGHTKCYSPPKVESPYIIDLRLAPLLARLRDPPPTVHPNTSEAFLPLPNTTPWPLPASVRMLMRARAQMRRQAGDTPTGGNPNPGEGANGADPSRRVPGGMDARDG